MFEGNLFGDETLKLICKMIPQLGYVLVLNISKCNITDIGAEFIAELLKAKNLQLKALLMHWNKITGRGSAHLAAAMDVNESLSIFDASFNSFGSSNLQKNNSKSLINSKKVESTGESDNCT